MWYCYNRPGIEVGSAKNIAYWEKEEKRKNPCPGKDQEKNRKKKN